MLRARHMPIGCSFEQLRSALLLAGVGLLRAVEPPGVFLRLRHSRRHRFAASSIRTGPATARDDPPDGPRRLPAHRSVPDCRGLDGEPGLKLVELAYAPVQA